MFPHGRVKNCLSCGWSGRKRGRVTPTNRSYLGGKLMIRNGNLYLESGAPLKSFVKKDKFWTPKKSCIFFHPKIFLAGKLGVQDYAVVYPPNGTHCSLWILTKWLTSWPCERNTVEVTCNVESMEREWQSGNFVQSLQTLVSRNWRQRPLYRERVFYSFRFLLSSSRQNPFVL